MAFGIDDIIGNVLGIVNKFIPDPAQKAQAEAELRSTLVQWDQAQNQVNAAEAQNNSIFVAGWRPFIGWCCGGALAYQYLLVPLAVWAASWMGHDFPPPPALDDTMWQLMFGMLGMGGLRTYEKIRGVAK
ncbi:MAG TPA: holin family protein [Stellaceae bacterium]|nr:holin family protein [Stellaceae bacterium]